MLIGKQREGTMGAVIIRSKVKDYATWRSVFDSRESERAAAGLANTRVFRSAGDMNEVVVVMDSKDSKMAKDFAASPDLKEAMMKSGVIDMPTVYFLEST
jgi:hypothetical protein